MRTRRGISHVVEDFRLDRGVGDRVRADA